MAFAHEDLLTQIKDLDQRIEASPSADLLIRRADLRRRHQEWEKALGDYQAAAKLTPGSSAIAVGRAQVHLDRGSPDEALRSLAAVLADAPDHPAALLLQARALGKQGKTGQASTAFSKAIALLDPPLPEHFIEHADLLAGAAAIIVLDEGIARLGDLVSLHSRALELEIEAGSREAALGRTRRVLAVSGGENPLWRIIEGEILADLGRQDEARQSFAAALKHIHSLNIRRRNAPAVKQLEQRARQSIDKL